MLDTDNMSGCGGVREGQSWEEPAGPSLPASLISGREGVRGDSGAVPRLGCGGLGALRLGLCKSFLHLGQSELTGVVGGCLQRRCSGLSQSSALVLSLHLQVGDSPRWDVCVLSRVLRLAGNSSGT